MNLLRAFVNVASFGLNALCPAPLNLLPAAVDFDADFNPPGDFWAAEQPLITRTPRIITDCGLGVDEQDSEWSDCDGDHWRYNHMKREWENTIRRPDLVTSWYPALPHERNAPYTEILESSSAAGAVRPDTSDPTAEESPAPDCRRGLGAGHPNLLDEMTAEELFGLILTAADGDDLALAIRLMVPWAQQLIKEIDATLGLWPNLSRDDLMDAANAVSHIAGERPAFAQHWRGLQHRLETAAEAASK